MKAQTIARVFLSTSALTLLLCADLLTQEVPIEGDRVRIAQADGTLVTGVFQFASQRGVVLRPEIGQEPPVIPFGDVEVIERSLGRHERLGRTVLISIGASVSVIGALTAMRWEEGESFWSRSRGEATLIYGGVLGTLLGASIGVVVGSTVKYERWESVSLPSSRLGSVQIHPTFTNGIGFAASLPVGDAR